MSKVDLRILDHGNPTDKEREYIEAIVGEGTQEAAASKCGVSRSTIRQALDRVRKKAASNGYAPDEGLIHPAPAGMYHSGNSTMYVNGEERVKWVSNKPDKAERDRLYMEALIDALEDYRGCSKLVEPPELCNKDLLSIYPLADMHINMLASKAETGEEWNTKKIVRQVKTGLSSLLKSTEDSETCLLLQLGDMLHCDNEKNRTEASGNYLNVDGMWSDGAKAATKLMLWAIDAAKKKHKTVYVWCAPGNHDDKFGKYLNIWLKIHYENDPRVQVLGETNPIEKFHFGRNLFCMMHGDGVKPKDMPLYMQMHCKDEWSQADHFHCYYGHFHTEEVQRIFNVVVERFGAIAGKDYWHHKKFKSGRLMTSITFHKEMGEISRKTFGLDKLS